MCLFDRNVSMTKVILQHAFPKFGDVICGCEGIGENYDLLKQMMHLIFTQQLHNSNCEE